MRQRLFSLGTACALALAAVGCGGGGTNPATSDAGPLPEPLPPNTTPWRNNPTAEDLRDHWNNPAPLAEQLSLEPVDANAVDERKRAIQTLLTNAERLPGETGTKLRNVPLDAISIIGERNGITYGQWRGGPAGTLHIEFDFTNAPQINAHYRAALDRAGKLWSHRILDRFEPHQERIWDFDVDTDGLFIAVYTKSGHTSSGRPVGINVKGEGFTDFEPWFGEIRIGRDRMAHSDRTRDNLMSHSMMHEVGHVLGFSVHTDAPYWERYVDRQANTWNGPQAVAANGGQPVPFQWLDQNRQPVPPHAPGATRNPSHTGVCTSIMAYCSYPNRNPNAPLRPSELDLAFLADMGYEISDPETGSEPELYGYGAWGRYSAWGAGVERLLVHNGYRPDDRLRASADAFGSAPDQPLASSGLKGEVTWAGSLIGVDLGSAKLPPVAGDAELRVHLETLDGTATFDHLTVHSDGTEHPFRAPSLEYEIEIGDNAFSDAAGRIEGGFFGPTHEEMAGVLDDRSPEVNLLAGFGGTR